MEPLDDYEVLNKIGQGGFSSVYRAIHKFTHIPVAIKVMKKNFVEDPTQDQIVKREIEILKIVKHPFVCWFYDFFESPDNYYIVMEMAENGTILDYVNQGGSLSEKEAGLYFAQIVSVLNFLHTKCQIAHRDMKAENVLLDKFKNVRIIDFGLSNSKQQDKLMQTACGSPAYASPEMILGRPYDFSTDTWSAGILLFAICAGYLPFDDPNIQSLMQKIVYRNVTYPPHFSPKLKDLLEKMLVKDPKDRISFQEIIQHPWLADYQKVCEMSVENFDHLDSEILEQVNRISNENGVDLGGQEGVTFNILKRDRITNMLYSMVNPNRFPSIPSFPTKVLPRPVGPVGGHPERPSRPSIVLPVGPVGTNAQGRRRSVLLKAPPIKPGPVQPKSAVPQATKILSPKPKPAMY